MHEIEQESLFAPVEDVKARTAPNTEVKLEDVIEILTRIERLENIAIRHSDRLQRLEKAQSNLRYRIKKNGGKSLPVDDDVPSGYVKVSPYLEKVLKVSGNFAGDLCRTGMIKSAKRLNPTQEFSAWIALKTDIDAFLAKNYRAGMKK